MTEPGSASAQPNPPGIAVVDRESQLRFLLIEDSVSDSELVRALLRREFPNGDLDVATSLELALRLLAESEYDLILADLNLPDAEGDAVVRAVRGAFPQPALTVLTGRVDASLALLALAQGAQDYLVKGERDGPHLADALLHGLQRNRTEQMAHSQLIAALKLESDAAEQLRALDAAKNDSLGAVSHDLRTPLASIFGYADLLQAEGGLTESQAAHVAVIARNAARLSVLTENLLLASGSNSQDRVMEHVELDLRAVVSSAREVVATLGIGKGVVVRYELPDGPVHVAGDAGQLERVVLNLLSNAIKFTDSGGTVTCRVSGTPRDAYVVVVDTGIGIPMHEQQQLFDKFFRAAGARARAIEGSGLGLHIAASIVGNHGGELTVESVAGDGSTFTVRLPALASQGSDLLGEER